MSVPLRLPTSPRVRLRCLWGVLAGIAACCCSLPLPAQAPPVPGTTAHNLPAVTIAAKADEALVEKSYRRMLAGMDYFEAHHALAPDATLRFRLYPREPGTDMREASVDVIGTQTMFAVALAADQTFALPRNASALHEDAAVVANQRRASMTWRADIRTPGLPPGTRRLGDLRLECEVGMAAGLVSEPRSFISRLLSAMMDTPAYCRSEDPYYLFFAERPLFSVALVHGGRRAVLPVDRLYAAASIKPDLREELPLCDCRLLVDRTYYLPLNDTRWPDDTRVEFEYFDDAPDGPAATLPTHMGDPVVVHFDSGWQVKVWRAPPPARGGAPAEFVALVDPSGNVRKTRTRQAGPADQDTL